MENVRMIDLLTKIKEYIQRRDNISQRGICKAIEYIYCTCQCTFDEYVNLKSFFAHNKPTALNQYKEFYNTPYWRDNGYWWIPINKQPRTKQIRINYLITLINNLK